MRQNKKDFSVFFVEDTSNVGDFDDLAFLFVGNLIRCRLFAFNLN